MAIVKRMIHRLGQWYQSETARRVFESQQFTRTNERPIEYAFVFRWLNTLQPHTVLDVGTGTTALPALMRTCGFQVTAIDNVKDYWSTGMFNPHWHVIDDNIVSTKLAQQFDAITCVSVLEHIVEHEVAIRSMLKLLRPGGHLLLTCPYRESQYVKNVYECSGSYGRDLPYICQQFSRVEVNGWLGDEAIVEHQELWKCFESEAWSCGNLVRPPQQVSVNELHQLSCMAIKKKEV